MKWFNKLILMISFIFFTANGGWVDLGGGGIEGKSPDITLISDDASGCQIEVILYGFYLDTIIIPEGFYSKITLPSASYRMEKGNPQLPKLNFSIIIPDNGGVSCKIQNETFKIFDVLPVIPSKGSLLRTDDPDTIPYTFNDIYNNGEWFPNIYQELYEPFIICDYRGINTCLNVFRHNPTQNLLEVATKFDVVLTYDNPQFVIKDSISGGFVGLYENFFLNFSESHYHAWFPNKLVIMTANDDEFYSEALRLRNWKMKKGIVVDEVIKGEDIPGWPNQYEIQNYMRNKWENNHVYYFLIIGAFTRFPYYSIAGWPADPCYILFTPNDWYPDAFLSRLPGRDAIQIRTMIDKLLYYERLDIEEAYPFDWTKNSLAMASSEESPNTHIPDRVRKEYMRQMLGRKYPNSFGLYDNECTPENITSHLSEGGRAFVNFMGHGYPNRWTFFEPYIDPVFHINHVWPLNNNYKLPFVYSVACWVCAWQEDEPCFGEAWLQRADYCGAVGFYGASVPQQWDPPIWADSVAIRSFTYDYFINEHFPNTIGEILYTGGVDMIQQYPHPTIGPETFKMCHLFGDASMQLRFGQQCTLLVTHPEVVPPSKPFDVYVYYKDYNNPQQTFEPCANAVVCLWKEDENFHIYKLTNQYGHTHFDAAPRRMGGMYVTVTKYNAGAYEGSITICDTNVGPNRGGQSNNIEIVDGYMNLIMTPSISGKSFWIGIPYYATSVDIYDKTGMLVKKVEIDKSEFIWNGMDESSKLLTQGIYFIKASGNGQTEVKKVLLIR